jgi:Holliday junction resolvase
MAVNSRSKGKMGEREIALLMRQCGYANARRSAQYCGNTGEAPDVVGVDGLHIEVKRREQIQDEVFIQQAEKEAKKGLVPVVMYRRSREKWKVCLRLDVFMAIWGELTELQRYKIMEKMKFIRK